MHRLFASSLLIAICCVTAPSLAADAANPDDYVFGTSLVLTSPRQLVDPNNGWWADMLPMEYNSAQGTIVKAINAARKARGETELIDWKTYPIQVGSETTVGAQFEYNIDFQHMQPADVDVALAQFPLEGKLAELPHTVRPLRTGYFSADSTGTAVTSLTLDVLGQKLVFGAEDSFAAAREKVAGVLAARFGDRAKFDMSWNRFVSALGNGSDSFNIYITVYLDGAEKNVPTGEGGE